MTEKHSYSGLFPVLTNTNGGSDTSFLYRSLISKWPDSLGKRTRRFYVGYKNRLELIGFSLRDLYMIAFYGHTLSNSTPQDSLYGKVAELPVLQIKDSSLFASDYSPAAIHNLYSYSFVSTKLNPTIYDVGEELKMALAKTFNYTVSFETRLIPYWKLVATEDAKLRLRTKGGKSFCDQPIPHEEYVVQNCTLNFIINVLSLFHENDVFINETGIKENVDMKLAAKFSDINDVKIQLRKHGLDLIRAERPMEVMVIKDGTINSTQVN